MKTIIKFRDDNFNSQGMTLIEVLIVTAIMMIIGYVFLEMSVSQRNETKSLTDKLASLDFQKYLLDSFNDEICSSMFVGQQAFEKANRLSISAGYPQLDDSTVSSLNVSFQYIPILEKEDGTLKKPTQYIAEVEKKASPISDNLKIESISLQKLVKDSASSRLFEGELTIKYKNPNLIRAIHSAVVRIGLRTDLNNNIVRCSLGGTPIRPTLVMAIHQQSDTSIQCPEGFREFSKGFSYAYYSQTSDSYHMSNLSSPGSCMEIFDMFPFLHCTNGECNAAKGNSGWLANSSAVVTGSESDSVSRCLICKSDRPTSIVVVEQKIGESAEPDCPQGAKELWLGFAFAYNKANGSSSDPSVATIMNDLNDPSSCLREFRPDLFLECFPTGTCKRGDKYSSFWKSNKKNTSVPVPATIKDVAKCRVCAFIE
jgi:hypothetical protein